MAKDKEKNIKSLWHSNDDQRLLQPPKPANKLISRVVFFFLAALFGSLVGLWLENNYILTGKFNLPGVKRLLWLNNLPGQNVVINQEQQVTITADEQRAKLAAKLQTVAVAIYRQPEEATKFLTVDEFLGHGVLVTNDGWLLTTKAIGDVGREALAVVYQGEVFKPQEIKIDDYLKLALISITPKEQMMVVHIAPPERIALGQEILSVGNIAQQKLAVQVNYLNQLDYKIGDSAEERIDSFNDYYQSQLPWDNNWQGAGAFSLAGELVGLLTIEREQKVILPSWWLNSYLTRALNKTNANWVSLGLGYYDLTKVVGLTQTKTHGLKHGALLTAIEPEDKKQLPGLEPGQIITQVNNEEVNNSNSLARLIQSYSPGQEVNLTIVMPDNSEATVKIKLAE